MIIECTKDNPWNLKHRQEDRVRHHDIKCDGDGDTYQAYKCLNCGTRWKKELPQ